MCAIESHSDRRERQGKICAIESHSERGEAGQDMCYRITQLTYVAQCNRFSENRGGQETELSAR